MKIYIKMLLNRLALYEAEERGETNSIKEAEWRGKILALELVIADLKGIDKS